MPYLRHFFCYKQSLMSDKKLNRTFFLYLVVNQLFIFFLSNFQKLGLKKMIIALLLILLFSNLFLGFLKTSLVGCN